MAVSKSVVVELAPIVRFHPSEKYFPMDPMEFIRTSRFRHHKSWQADQGYNKRRKKWVTSNSHHRDYYGVPVSYINQFRAWRNGENRRPRDSNNGSSWNVFLEPKGKPRGLRQPTAKVPVFYSTRSVDTSTIPAPIRRMFGIKLEKYDKIQYWWFIGYNDGPGPGGVDNHQGDWEHVTAKVVKGKLVDVSFAQHGTRRYVEASKLRWKGNRFLVYSALGSHGSYERAGRFSLMLGFKDETKNGGSEWDTSQLIKSLSSQPWRDYAGAWGEGGEFDHTTGPLGPWYKRKKD